MKAKIHSLVCVVAVGLVNSGIAWATTYYVDYSSGSDGNTGTSMTSAWKHAPGDPSATGNAGAKVLAAGDVVQFKGGVKYRGVISLTRSGAATQPIVYKGDGWGSGPAIMEGADPFSATWTACASASACGDNPRFAEIYWAPAPAAYDDFETALFENDDFLWYSQGPNPGDPFYHDEIGDYYEVPFPQGSVIQRQGSITDPRHLTQTSSTFWNGAHVVGWVTGNVIEIKPVTSFNPQADTLYHEAFANPPYDDRPGRYSLMNHVALIDRAGEYSYDPTARRIYLWPRNGRHPSTNSYSFGVRDTAFGSDSALSSVTIEGFYLTHFTLGVALSNTSSQRVTVRKNQIKTFRSHNRYAIFVNARDSVVEDNSVIDANRAVGILSSADNIVIQRNHVERTSRQGIWLMGASNSKVLNNTVTNIAGSHSNGISIYSESSNILISGNRILNVNSPLTYEASSDLTFTNNIIAPSGQVSDWFGMSGTVAFYHNVFLGSNFSISSSPNYIFKNNILAQTPPGSHSYNIYVKSVGNLQSGEQVVTDLNRLFVNPAVLDFSLKVDSPAVDAGTVVPVGADISGTARPLGAGFDIGAYEYNASAPPPPAPKRVLRSNPVTIKVIPK